MKLSRWSPSGQSLRNKHEDIGSPYGTNESSVAKENRFVPYQENDYQDIYQAPTLTQNRSRHYDRNGMLKEVNDIINELQVMLKPKIVKIESEDKGVPLTKVSRQMLRECAKDLSKTDFWSESISLQSWKENFNDSDLISISNYNDCQEPQIEHLDPSIFSPCLTESNVLYNKTNQRLHANVKPISSVHGKKMK